MVSGGGAGGDAGQDARRQLLGPSSPLLSGLPLPVSLRDHKAVATILSHSAGHLPLSELRAAIEAKRAEDERRQRDRQLQLQLHPHTDVGHELDYSLDPDMEPAFEGAGQGDERLQAAIFTATLSAYRQHERMIEINPSQHRIGQAVMTEEERAGLEHRRQEADAASRAEHRAKDRQRMHSAWSQHETSDSSRDWQPASRLSVSCCSPLLLPLSPSLLLSAPAPPSSWIRRPPLSRRFEWTKRRRRPAAQTSTRRWRRPTAASPWTRKQWQRAQLRTGRICSPPSGRICRAQWSRSGRDVMRTGCCCRLWTQPTARPRRRRGQLAPQPLPLCLGPACLQQPCPCCRLPCRPPSSGRQLRAPTLSTAARWCVPDAQQACLSCCSRLLPLHPFVSLSSLCAALPLLQVLALLTPPPPPPAAIEAPLPVASPKPRKGAATAQAKQGSKKP